MRGGRASLYTVEALGACEREEFLPTSQNSRRKSKYEFLQHGAVPQRHAVVLRQAYKQSAIAIFTDKNGPRDTLAVGMRASFIETSKDVTRVGFEPTPPRGQRPERCALDRSAIVSVMHA